MNLNDPGQWALKKPSEIEITLALAPTEEPYQGPPAKTGWSYYNAKHGEKMVEILRKLLTYPSRSSTINCRNLAENARTRQQRYKQSLAWLIDGGFNAINIRPGDVTNEEWEELKQVASKLNIERKNQMLYLICVSAAFKDDVAAMEEFKPSDTIVPETHLATLITEVEEFIQTAAEDTSKTINGVEPEMIDSVRKLLSVDEKLDFDYNENFKQLNLVKMSEQTLAAVRGGQ